MKDLVYAVLFALMHFGQCNEIGFFWQIADPHWDFTYYQKQISCTSHIPSSKLGYFGDYLCDTPWSVLNESLIAMKSIKLDVDFLVWTGDNVPHPLMDESTVLNTSINLEVIRNITDLIREVFPNVSVYPNLGNHDHFPDAQFPATKQSENPLYNGLADYWKVWLNDTEVLKNFREGAYYSVKTKSGLRIVALNTNLYFTSNKQVENTADPAGQFEWVETVLSKSRNAKEKVFITAHIFPGLINEGTSWMYERFNEKLMQIIVKYSDVITATFFGHNHEDMFKVFYNKKKNPVVPAFISPSITPWRYKIGSFLGPAHNPGIRLIKFNRKTGIVLDIKQYYFDLIEANRKNKITWKKEYSLQADYNVKDGSSASMDQLLTELKQNETLFSKYNRQRYVSVQPSLQQPCKGRCRKGVLCAISNHNPASYNNCLSDTGSLISSLNTALLLFLIPLALFHII